MENLKACRISMEDIAREFGYSNVKSFRSSSAKKRMLKGADGIVALVRKYYREKYLELFDE